MYHAHTVKAHRKFVAFAAVLSAASVASAQAAEEGAGRSTAWQSYARERHVVGRIMAGTAFRLNDAFGGGFTTPPYVMVDGHYLFVNAGNFHMGPSLGLQLGFDAGHSPGVQFGLVPGWTGLMRLSQMFGITGRVGIPFMILRGVTERVAVPASDVNGHSAVQAPQNPRTAYGGGVELGVGGALYFLSGVAATLEINGGVYFGDSFYTFPYVGAALGLMVDYELLP